MSEISILMKFFSQISTLNKPHPGNPIGPMLGAKIDKCKKLNVSSIIDVKIIFNQSQYIL